MATVGLSPSSKTCPLSKEDLLHLCYLQLTGGERSIQRTELLKWSNWIGKSVSKADALLPILLKNLNSIVMCCSVTGVTEVGVKIFKLRNVDEIGTFIFT